MWGDYTWIVVTGALAAFLTAYGIGANDVANAFASSVAARTLTMKQALAIAAVCEFGGAVLLGAPVTRTVAGGIAYLVHFERQPEMYMYGMLCSLTASGTWLILATFLELPVSTTHSIIGAVVGFALVFGGVDAVVWLEPSSSFPYMRGLVPVIVSWFTSPIISALATCLFFFLVRTLILRRSESLQIAFLSLPVLVLLTVFINTFFVLHKGASGRLEWSAAQAAWVSAAAGGGCMVLTILFVMPLVKRQIYAQLQERRRMEQEYVERRIQQSSRSTRMPVSGPSSTALTNSGATPPTGGLPPPPRQQQQQQHRAPGFVSPFVEYSPSIGRPSPPPAALQPLQQQRIDLPPAEAGLKAQEGALAAPDVHPLQPQHVDPEAGGVTVAVAALAADGAAELPKEAAAADGDVPGDAHQGLQQQQQHGAQGGAWDSQTAGHGAVGQQWQAAHGGQQQQQQQQWLGGHAGQPHGQMYYNQQQQQYYSQQQQQQQYYNQQYYGQQQGQAWGQGGGNMMQGAGHPQQQQLQYGGFMLQRDGRALAQQQQLQLAQYNMRYSAQYTQQQLQQQQQQQQFQLQQQRGAAWQAVGPYPQQQQQAAQWAQQQQQLQVLQHSSHSAQPVSGADVSGVAGYAAAAAANAVPSSRPEPIAEGMESPPDSGLTDPDPDPADPTSDTRWWGHAGGHAMTRGCGARAGGSSPRAIHAIGTAAGVSSGVSSSGSSSGAGGAAAAAHAMSSALSRRRRRHRVRHRMLCAGPRVSAAAAAPVPGPVAERHDGFGSFWPHRAQHEDAAYAADKRTSTARTKQSEDGGGSADGDGESQDRTDTDGGSGGGDDDGGAAWQNTFEQLKAVVLHGTRVDVHAVVERDELAERIHEHAEVFDPATEHAFKYLQIVTAICDSFSHGANDVANSVGPFTAIWYIYQNSRVDYEANVPIWILALGGVGIVVGLATYGYNIIKAIGVRLSVITPSRGFCIELSTALVVVVASTYGLPVSTTHCQVGATAGMGLMEGSAGVNWLLALQFFVGWVVTLLITGLLSAALFAAGAYAPSIIQGREILDYQDSLSSISQGLLMVVNRTNAAAAADPATWGEYSAALEAFVQQQLAYITLLGVQGNEEATAPVQHVEWQQMVGLVNSSVNTYLNNSLPFIGGMPAKDIALPRGP